MKKWNFNVVKDYNFMAKELIKDMKSFNGEGYLTAWVRFPVEAYFRKEAIVALDLHTFCLGDNQQFRARNC